MSAVILAAIAALVAVSAFFSSSEIAVFSLEEYRLGGFADAPMAAVNAELGTDLPTEGETAAGLFAEALGRAPDDPGRRERPRPSGRRRASGGLRAVATG